MCGCLGLADEKADEVDERNVFLLFLEEEKVEDGRKEENEEIKHEGRKYMKKENK